MIRLFIVLFLGASIYAQQPPLEELLATNNYTQACICLRNKEHKTPIEWYNYGNCQYNMQQYEQAYDAWLHAYVLGTNSVRHDAAFNMDLLHEQQPEFNARVPYQWELLTGIEYYRRWFRIPMWQWIAVFLLLAVCLLIIMRPRNWVRWALLLSLVWLITLIPIVGKYRESSLSIGLVEKERVELYGGPDGTYPVIATLEPRDVVIVKRHRGNWLLVEAPERNGWVEQSDITMVRA